MSDVDCFQVDSFVFGDSVEALFEVSVHDSRNTGLTVRILLVEDLDSRYLKGRSPLSDISATIESCWCMRRMCSPKARVRIHIIDSTVSYD